MGWAQLVEGHGNGNVKMCSELMEIMISSILGLTLGVMIGLVIGYLWWYSDESG